MKRAALVGKRAKLTRSRLTKIQKRIGELERKLEKESNYLKRRAWFQQLRRAQLVLRMTPREQRVWRLLSKLGVRVTPQKSVWSFAANKPRYCDFYIRKPYRIVLEIDGPEHAAISNAAWEADVRRQLPDDRIVRLTNAETDELDDQRLEAKLRELIQN